MEITRILKCPIKVLSEQKISELQKYFKEQLDTYHWSERNEVDKEIDTLYELFKYLHENNQHNNLIELYKVFLTSDIEKGKGYDIIRYFIEKYDSKVDELLIFKSYNCLAGIYNRKNRCNEALELYFKALDIIKKLKGKGHVDTAKVYDQIASVYFRGMKQYDKALEYYDKALKVRENLFGPYLNAKIIDTHCDIAKVYFALEDYQNALEILNNLRKSLYEILQTNDKEFKKEDLEKTAQVLEQIGLVYISQKMPEEALNCFTKVLSTYKQISDESLAYHSDSVNNGIAVAYFDMGNYVKAAEFYNKTIEKQKYMCEYNNIPFDPDMTMIYVSYATFGMQVRNKQAMSDFQNKTHKIKEITIAQKKYIDIINNYNECASEHLNQKEYDKALSYYLEVLNIYSKFFGEIYEHTGVTCNNIGNIYDNKDMHDEALAYFNKALEIIEKSDGLNSESTCIIYDNIANIYKKQNKLDKALELYKKILNIEEVILGKSVSDTEETYGNILKTLDSQEKYEEVLDILLKHYVHESNFYNIINNFTNKIIKKYAGQSKYDKAIEWSHKAIDILEKLPVPNYESISRIYNNIGCFHMNQKRHTEAQEIFKKALKIIESRLKEYNPIAYHINYNMANNYFNHGEYGNSISYFKRALVINEKLMGKEDPNNTNICAIIATVYEKQGAYDKANEWNMMASK